MKLRLRLLVLALFGLSRALQAGAPGVPERQQDPRERKVSTPGLRATVRVGLGGLRYHALPTAVVVDLDNQGNHSIDGRIEVEELESDDADGARTKGRAVLLPPRSRKRIHFAIRLGYGDLSIRLRTDERVLWQRVVRGASGHSLGNAPSFEWQSLRLLSVDPQGARLRFPVQTRSEPGEIDGLPLPGRRPIQSLHAPAETLPTCAPPLLAFHAIVLSGRTRENALTPAQWKALGRYVVWGGCVVLPRNGCGCERLFVRHLPAAMRTPLAFVACRAGAGLTVACKGTGRVVRVSEQLFHPGAAGAHERVALAGYLEACGEPAFPPLVAPYQRDGSLPANAGASGLLVAGLFVAYAIVTGPLLIVVFRRRRRRVVAVFLAVSIGGFVLLAAATGQALGARRGDLRWATVTTLTHEGGVQWGLFTATSAGARHHHLRLDGTGARLWLLPSRRCARTWAYVYSEALEPVTNLAFDCLPREEPAALEQIPIIPWNHRQLLATALWPEGRAVDIQVSLAEGKVHVDCTNHLSVPLRQVNLMLGAWLPPAAPDAADHPSKDEGEDEGDGGDEDDEPLLAREYYQIVPLRTLLSGRRSEVSKSASFQLDPENMRYYSLWLFAELKGKADPGSAGLVVPRVTAQGRVFGVLTGKLPESPALSIASSHFDAEKGVHLAVQILDEAHLPSPEAVFRAAEQAAARENEEEVIY